MMRKFEMSDLGMLHYFLGLEIKQLEDGVFISQRKYAIDPLKRFNMLNCKVAATPMNLNEKLQSQDGTDAANGKVFRSIVGDLIYLTHPRPDISFSRSVEDRKSTFGSVFILGSGVVSWRSKKQATIALSLTEAEYVAAISSAC
ncbi:hypothetical protein RJ640_006251 [Escallonia rubra]|uniref:Reverse transcriptase Ty1/copia-type domain-containing protein n=1 Tax=Escallonia rubra TaxID=112253 RepID=A0AA88UDJ7_9ASTE|nr:hypothetical protein RJ640_006251 [Escallonia rubra]